MVQWKGDIAEAEAGGKAYRLDSIENFQVPNFFVLTRKETRQLVDGANTTEEIVNREFPESLASALKDAYDDVGVSSEVRNASGEARDLVEGQRSSGRVSVRISGNRKGVYENRLNVGSSSLLDAVKEVVASFYSVENEHDYPAVIVQKMIEPGYTGAAIPGYMGNYGLVEAVEGLGASLENGITKPDFYLLREGDVIEGSIPKTQLKLSLNPMSSSVQRKEIKRESPMFEESEVEELMENLEAQDMGVKFVYKRGSFYLVDAFDSGHSSPFETSETSLSGIRVSEGEIEGTVGEEVDFSDETLPPDEYQEALVARKGGYTSTHAQLARSASKPAIFSFERQLDRGQKLSLGPREVEPENTGTGSPQTAVEDRDLPERASGESVTATEVLPINSGDPGIYLSSPFPRKGYAVTERAAQCTTVAPSSYLRSYAEVFAFDGDRAVLDTRTLDRKGVAGAMEYIDAELKLVLLEYPDREVIRTAVVNGFDAVGVNRSHLESTREMVAREERKFLLEKIREL